MCKLICLGIFLGASAFFTVFILTHENFLLNLR